MLHILVKTSLTLCVCTVLLGTALGQSTSATLRIGCTDIYKEQHTLYLRQVKGKKVVSQKTQLNIHNMSEPFRYKGSSRLSFYRSQEEAEDTENKSKPCATCRVPAEGSYFLLLVPSVSKTGEKEKDNALPDYRILVIPSGDVAFGSFMLMNYSSHPLHARIDKTKGKVLPGKRKVFHFPKGVSNARTRMFIEPSQGKFQSIRSSNWNLTADTREFVIVHDSPKGGVMLKHITDKNPAK